MEKEDLIIEYFIIITDQGQQHKQKERLNLNNLRHLCRCLN